VTLRVSAAARIDAPADVIWELYADVPGTVDWVPFTEEILEVVGPPGLGQRYTERTRLLGIADVAEWEIVAWDPPRRQVQASHGFGMASLLTIEIGPDPDGDGCLVRQRAELRSRLIPPVGWLHEAAFSLVARHGLRRAVSAAKAHLEDGRPTA
jgi:Polyketide cyclase / dehydrase and lipid transport